jgi:hypothetical protein
MPGDGWYVETPTLITEAFLPEGEEGLFFTAKRGFSTQDASWVFGASLATG